MPRADKPTTSIADTLADIAKTHQLNIGSLSTVAEATRWLSTGNLGIDYTAGHGLPQGRSCELYGPPSSGKTTTGLQTAAELQRDIITDARDEYILYLDYEKALDPEYCANLGLDVEHPSFLLAQPHSMEQGAEAALKLIESGKIKLSIWDSVAAMAPITRLEGDFDQRTAAMNKARLMSGLMLQLTPLLHTTGCCAVFINHAMEAVEMTGRPGLPPKTTTPGGKALKYYASVRLEYKPIKPIKGRGHDALTGAVSDQPIATQVIVRCTKNKVASPFREAETRIRFGRGFDNAWTALQILVAHKQITKDSAWYRFDPAKVPTLVHPAMTTAANGRASLQGEAAVLAFADTYPDWRDCLLAVAGQLVDDGAPAGTMTVAADIDIHDPSFGPATSDLDAMLEA